MVRGHELGHLLGRHFTTNKKLPQFDKELQADRFAGCAAGALNADWSHIAGFIEKVRSEKPSVYPSSRQSLEIAKPQFDSCHARSSAGVSLNGPVVIVPFAQTYSPVGGIVEQCPCISTEANDKTLIVTNNCSGPVPLMCIKDTVPGFALDPLLITPGRLFAQTTL